MATENLQIPDIQASQNQKEVTANAAHNLLDRAMNGRVNLAMSSGINNLTTTQHRENFVIELTGTPGAPFTLEMADTNQKTLAIVNNSNDQCTVQNPSAGGSGQPVIQVGEASIFHFDGTNFFDFSALALTVATWIGLTDTPSVYAGQSGLIPTVNNAETALEFIKTAMKLPVRAATVIAATLTTDFEATDIIDGVTLVAGDRILVKDQASGSENGLYIVQTAAPPIRTDDFDDNVDVEGGVLVSCQEGTANADTVFVLTNNGAITVGSTALVFSATFAPATNFTTLTDTPANYVDQDGKSVRVTDAETGLEFIPQAWKDPVRLASTVAATLASDFENTDLLDGIALVTGDRILIKNQASAIENGLYTVEATGAPTRAIDLNDNTDIVLGGVVHVLLGTVNANTSWEHTAGTDLGVDDQDFTKFNKEAFLDLDDTPSVYTDQDGKSVRVTDAETGLEFIPQAWKDPVRLATTAALTLASDLEGGVDSLDGVSLVIGDRVLVKDQASAIENGLYDITAGAPTRTIDLNDNTDIVLGSMVHVLLGTANANTTWEHTAGSDLDVDNQDFTEMEAANQAYLDLTDTPAAYTDQDGKSVRVNDAENAVEFVPQAWKDPVRLATTGALTLASDLEGGVDSLDGVSLIVGDRVLVKDQASAIENGLYTVTAGAPDRAIDLNDNTDIVLGSMVHVLLGTANANTTWEHTAGTDLGVDAQDFTEMEAANQAFLDLTDAPSAYTDASGMDVRVNAAENAVEFVARTLKDPVRIATIANISLTGEQTLDGVLTATDRVLVKAQSSGAENGIYVTAAGAWARAIDFDDDADAIEGAVIPVIDGDVGAKTTWMHTTTAAVTIGSTALTFAKMQPTRGFMPLVLGSLRDLSTNEIAGLLDDTTTPSFERINGATDKGLRVLWGLSNNDEVAFPEIYMPPDFDSDVDITVHIVGEMSGATDTPTIDVLVFDSSGDTEMGGVTATFTDTRAEKTVTLTAANITGHPLGWLSISLVPVGAHATDTLAIFSAWIEYTRKTA